jgi:hypothetical protein
MEVMSASKAKGFGNSHYCIISVQVQYEYVYTTENILSEKKDRESSLPSGRVAY